MLVCKNAMPNYNLHSGKLEGKEMSRLILTRMLKGLSYIVSSKRVNPKNALFRHPIKSRVSCSPLIGTSKRSLVKLLSFSRG